MVILTLGPSLVIAWDRAGLEALFRASNREQCLRFNGGSRGTYDLWIRGVELSDEPKEPGAGLITTLLRSTERNKPQGWIEVSFAPPIRSRHGVSFIECPYRPGELYTAIRTARGLEIHEMRSFRWFDEKLLANNPIAGRPTLFVSGTTAPVVGCAYMAPDGSARVVDGNYMGWVTHTRSTTHGRRKAFLRSRYYLDPPQCDTTTTSCAWPWG